MRSIGTRNERRAAVALERKSLRTGDWGAWERIELPQGAPGGGWLGRVRYIFRNRLYVVMCRPVTTRAGEVVHCSMRTASNLEPPWRDKQRIKNECFGADRVAVEIMPTVANLVDAADMYHMWVMPAGFSFDFGLGGEEFDK